MGENNKQKKNKKSNSLTNIILFVAVAAFAVSAVMLVKDKLQYKKENDAFAQMQLQAEQSMQGDKSPEELLLNHYAQLKQQNGDFAGWIRIDGTPLDYPVVHTPDDPEYYLRRAFDGSYSISGTPFVGENCDVNSTNVMIYGHRMNNDTMFTTLLDYAKKDYWQQHPQICFDTVDQLRVYDIIAAFYIDIPFADDPDAFHWYNYSGNIEGDLYNEYIQKVMEHAYYDTGVQVNTGDKLLTLTTCAYNDEEQRFVVVAKYNPDAERF